MRNREKILMQKIAKREKVKKKLNGKAPKAETATNGGEHNLTFPEISMVNLTFNCRHSSS